MIRYIIKRDGRKVPYDVTKISDAILMAATAVSDAVDENIKIADTTAKVVDEELQKDFNARKHPTVEQIQDYVESALISEGHALIAKEYILYRAERNKTRAMKANLMQVMEELTFKESDTFRGPQQVDAESFIGVKGFKAKGKRLTTYALDQVKELEPVRFPEPETENEVEEEEMEEVIDPDEGKSDGDIRDEITGQLKLF